jgi:hypothetical protein
MPPHPTNVNNVTETAIPELVCAVTGGTIEFTHSGTTSWSHGTKRGHYYNNTHAVLDHCITKIFHYTAKNVLLVLFNFFLEREMLSKLYINMTNDSKRGATYVYMYLHR